MRAGGGAVKRGAGVIGEVTRALTGVPYMTHGQAKRMRDFMLRIEPADVLEIGFHKGRSSCYIASVLEEMGRGHLTTIDRRGALEHDPSIHDTLSRTGLAHRVTPIFAERSYTWELGRMIRSDPRPAFDLCYFDGGHTWDMTGFGLLLVDALLRPGGWIVFDDLDWSIEGSIARRPESRRKSFASYSEDERTAKPVRMVWETLAPHLGYRELSEADGWGYARKPT